MAILDEFGDPLGPITGLVAVNASAVPPPPQADLMAALIGDLSADGALAGAAGVPLAGRVWEGRDLRRDPPRPHPYAVLVEVSGRHGSFTGRGDSLWDRYLDLHWYDVEPGRAHRLARLSRGRLRAAARAGRLDSREGVVKALLPGATRSLVDPRRSAGPDARAAVIGVTTQYRVVLAPT